MADLERENAALRRRLRSREGRLQAENQAEAALNGAALDAALDCIVTITAEGRIVAWNAAAERTFGYARDAALGQDLADLIVPPEARSRHRQGMARCLKTGQGRMLGRRIELEALRADGSRFPAELAISPVQVDGRPHFTAFLRDITERKRAESANARLAAIVSSSPDAVMSFSPDGLLRSWNAAAERLFGYTEAEAVGSSASLLVPPDCPEGPRGVFDWGMAGRSVQIETVRLHKDGTPIDVAISAAPMRAADGAIIGVSAIMRDIRAQKRAEAALRDSERRLRATYDHARVGIAEVDVNGRFLRVNEQLCERIGRSRDELLGMTFQDVAAPDDASPDLEQFGRLVAGDIDAYRLEKRYIDRAGQTFWVELSVSMVRDEAGRPLYGVRVTRDISERKRAEEHLTLLVHELNHRVKNTLASVQAITAQTLRNTGTPDHVQDALAARLLSLAKAHDVLTRENWESADLADIVAGALEAHQGREHGRIQAKGPSARVEPRIALSLSMALHELATDATKYGALSNESGRVDVSWRIQRRDGARRLRLRWKESGGPPVAAPTRKGFGSRLIERSVAAELGGEARIAFHPAGVVGTLSAPVRDAR